VETVSRTYAHWLRDDRDVPADVLCTHGSIRGRWRYGPTLRGPLVPGRFAEKRTTMARSGPPRQQSAEPAAYFTAAGASRVSLLWDNKPGWRGELELGSRRRRGDMRAHRVLRLTRLVGQATESCRV
jgi:hypothetical protein